MASFRIRPATEADIPAMYAIGAVGYPTTSMPFPDGTELRYFPDTPEADASERAWREGLMRKNLGLDRKRHVVFVVVEVGEDGDSSDDEKVVGYTVWDVPQTEGTDGGGDHGKSESEGEKTYPPHAIKETFDWCSNNKKEGLKRVFPNDEHRSLWELSELCIHPDYHGKGLGSQLYQHGFNHIGAQDKDFFFFARTPAVPFYLTRGATLPDDSRVLLRTVHDLMVWRHK